MSVVKKNAAQKILMLCKEKTAVKKLKKRIACKIFTGWIKNKKTD